MRRTHASGFTLVELLIVVVVLATIAAIAAPRLEAVTESGAEDRILRLVGGAAIRAQDLALRSGAPVRLVLDLDARHLELADDPPLALPSRGRIAASIGDRPGASSGRLELVVPADGLMPPLRLVVGDRPPHRLHPFTAELMEMSGP